MRVSPVGVLLVVLAPVTIGAQTRIPGSDTTILLAQASAAAPAQSPGRLPQPQRQPTGRIGVRAAFGVDVSRMTAEKSFAAVLGTSSVRGFGGGGELLDVWKRTFVRGGVSRASKDGDRVFVFDGQVIPMGVPTTISMIPIEVGGGWRFAPVAARRLTPYAGGGAVFLRYSETSSLAAAGDDVRQSNTGLLAFGGLEVPVARHLFVGGEAQYRRIPNAIGTGGVSQDFGESDLGGMTVRVLFGFKR